MARFRAELPRQLTRRLSVPLAATCGFIGALAMLVACAAAVDQGFVCPALVSYTSSEQLQILQAYKGLPEGSILRRVFQDYEAMRDADRACRGQTGTWGGL